MTHITLRQLRYVDALAHHGHFGRAAEACAVSQPALSMQVRDLEAALGTPIFERGPRQVRLTGFGESFVQRAREVLRAADELAEMARASRGTLSGPLRIGVIPTVAPYLLPRIVGELTRQYPGLDLRLRETLTPRLIEELSDGRLDTAIVALPVSEPAFAEAPLFTEDFVLVRPPEDADRPIPSPERLREMRLLLLEEGHCFRDQALDFCDMRATTPREMLDGSTLATLVQMVGAGMGVTLIPEMAVPVETRAAHVSVTQFDDPKPSRTIGMIWRRPSPLAGQLERLADVVRGAALPVAHEARSGK
jgi:LysR family hydrogen peroxide-inducible transcriptional activator